MEGYKIEMKESKEERPLHMHWKPCSMIREMEKAIDCFRMGLEEATMPALINLGPCRLPATDVCDEGTHYVVEAELPGLNKEEVSLEMDKDTLFIKAKKEEKEEVTHEGYVRRERGHLSFYRQIPIPEDADRENVQASLNNGVLQIIIQKMPLPEGEASSGPPRSSPSELLTQRGITRWPSLGRHRYRRDRH